MPGAVVPIPTFPLAFGHVIPPFWNTGIAIHFAHRVGALFVTIAVVATALHVFYHHTKRMRMSSMPYSLSAKRSMPTPNAKPVYFSAS